MTSSTRTKFETLINLVEADYPAMALQFLGDIKSLDNTEKQQLIDVLRERKLALGRMGDFLDPTEDFMRLGLECVFIDLSKGGDWLTDPVVSATEFVNSIKLDIGCEQIASLIAAGESEHEVEFKFNKIVRTSEDDDRFGDNLFLGVPHGGFVDLTSDTTIELETGIIRNLQFFMLPVLGEVFLDEADLGYAYGLKADVQVDENGNITLLTELTKELLVRLE